MSGAEYYDHTTYPAQGAQGSSAALRAELDSIENGFGKCPALSGNANKAVIVNSSGNAQTTTIGTLALAGNLATVGAVASTFTMTGVTALTFPTSGTLLSSATAVTVPQGGTGAISFTDGGVIVGNAAGVLQATSAGTEDYVLTSNGAGNDPSFKVAGGFIEAQTLSGNGFGNINAFTSKYDDYVYYVDNIDIVNADTLELRLGNAGVSDTGNNYSSYSNGVLVGSVDQAFIPIINSAADPAVTFDLKIEFMNMNSTGNKSIRATCIYKNNGVNTYTIVNLLAINKKNAAVSGFVFNLNNPLNTCAGSARLYGIVKG